MSFTFKQSKKKQIKLGLPLVLIDSVHFLKKSLENLVKNLEENEFFHLSQEFNANVLDLVQKKEFFFLMTTGIVLKIFRKVYLAKINLIIH